MSPVSKSLGSGSTCHAPRASCVSRQCWSALPSEPSRRSSRRPAGSSVTTGGGRMLAGPEPRNHQPLPELCGERLLGGALCGGALCGGALCGGALCGGTLDGGRISDEPVCSDTFCGALGGGGNRISPMLRVRIDR